MKKIIKAKFDLILFIIFIICVLFIIFDFIILTFGATMTIFGLFTFLIKCVVASFIFDYFFDKETK